MSYLNCNVSPIKVWVKKEYMHDFEKGHRRYERAIIVSAKSLPGLALTFQVLLDNGVMRDKLPVSAICWKKPDLHNEFQYPLDFLQLWDCFSYNITFSQFNFITGLRCSVYMKDKDWIDGEIIGTFDWSSEGAGSADLFLCEQPDEHKSGHFIALDNGQFAIQPNNRIKFYESSFVTKPFPEKPDYKVCQEFYKVEQSDKWKADDTDNQFYEIEEK